MAPRKKKDEHDAMADAAQMDRAVASVLGTTMNGEDAGERVPTSPRDGLSDEEWVLLQAAEDQIARAKQHDIAVKTMTGDLRDMILDTLRHEQNKRPWHERSEAEQRDTVNRVEQVVTGAITKCVDIIMMSGNRTILAVLEQIVIKDAIVGKIVVSKHDAMRHLLADATGQRILISIASADEFTGERAPVEIRPDQGDLEQLARSGAVHSEADDNHSDTPFA